MDSTLQAIFSPKTYDGKRIITLSPKKSIVHKAICHTMESRSNDPLYFLQKSDILYSRAKEIINAQKVVSKECMKELTMLEFLAKTNSPAWNVVVSQEDIDKNSANSPNIFVRIGQFIINIIKAIIAFIENVVRSIIHFFKYLALWKKNQGIAHQSIYRRYKNQLGKADLTKTMFILPYDFKNFYKNIGFIFERIRSSKLLQLIDSLRLDTHHISQQVKDYVNNQLDLSRGVLVGNEINLTDLIHIRQILTEVLYFGADLDKANGKNIKAVSPEDQIRMKLEADLFQKYKDPKVKIEVPLYEILNKESVKVLEDEFLSLVESVTRHTNAILDRVEALSKGIKVAEKALIPLLKGGAELFSSDINRTQAIESFKNMATAMGDLASLTNMLLTGIRFTSFYTTTTALKFRSDIFEAFQMAVGELQEIDEHISHAQPGEVDEGYKEFKRREQKRFGEYAKNNMSHLQENNMYISQMDEATNARSDSFFSKTMDFFGFGKKK